MNVDVKESWIRVYKERDRRKLARQKDLPKGLHDRLLEEAVSNCAAIDDLKEFFCLPLRESLDPVGADLEAGRFVLGRDYGIVASVGENLADALDFGRGFELQDGAIIAD